MAKYKSKKVEADGYKFDSKAEMDYYFALKNSKLCGLIKDFTLQPSFKLQETFKHPVKGTIHSIVYKADFLVHQLGEEKPSLVVDVKGIATPVSLIKYKMFLKQYSEYELKWESKSKKYGVNGWIDYFVLQKIRRENRKDKVKQHSSI